MANKKILIIDDEKGFTAMLKLNLEATGNYDVRVENDPCQAVATALHFKPSLILLDVIMPNMEGPDVAAHIRHHPQLDEIPLIFLTATVTIEEVKSHGGRIGGHPFVAKPSKLSDLLNSIETNIVSTN